MRTCDSPSNGAGINSLPKEWLAAVRHEQGRLMGRMESLGFGMRQEAVLQTLSTDVLKSSEIEGEKLDAEQVRSSIARRLGMDVGGLKAVDRNVEGVVEMMLDATRNYARPLTTERLFAWHASLFPTGRSGMSRIRVGAWRDESSGPMQVVSGPIERERVHYEATGAERIDGEMQSFLGWFNGLDEMDWVVKAALAHLWFVTIHPFDDGNGRIARTIADIALARSEQSSQRFYSVSAQIRQERAAYYDILEQTQRGTMDVTPWMIGSWDAWAGPLKARKPRSLRFSLKRASGNRSLTSLSMTASASSSVVFWKVLRGSSEHRNGQYLRSVPRTLPCVISCHWSNVASSCAIPKVDAVPATRSLISRQSEEPRPSSEHKPALVFAPRLRIL